MYDMYPWNEPADPGPAGGGNDLSQRGLPAAEAVQAALDRRDNGGDAAGPATR
ncbi:MAG: hypothetical protein JO132_15025 [Streptosporangiaceae bacterium]|nr:hypothetical protein [Streptosporangiaceae bacterium]